MDTIKAICECKNLSEDETIIAVRKIPLAGMGCWALIINFILFIVTAGGWVSVLVGYFLAEYFCNPKYKCQFCGNEIDKENYR